MSSQNPPDPITNTFNPGAWETPVGSTFNPAILDTKFVKFPTAQNAPITFPSSISAVGVTSTGTTTLSGATTTISSATTNLSGTNTTITGTTNICTTSGNSTTIGTSASSGSTTLRGSEVNIVSGTYKQVSTLLNNSVANQTLDTVIGNTFESNQNTLSTTFNKKTTTNGAVGALNPIACYTIALPSTRTQSQYYEIIVSGNNFGPGGYTYKGCFSITSVDAFDGLRIYPSSVSTLFSYNLGTGTPVITFTPSTPTIGLSITVNIQTSSINVLSPLGSGASTNQNFIATLIAYPSSGFNGLSRSYTITAI